MRGAAVIALQLVGLVLVLVGLWGVDPWLPVVAAGCAFVLWPEATRRRKG